MNKKKMIILDKPYISELLEETVLKNGYPVLKNKTVDDMNLSSDINYWDEDFAVEQIKNQNDFLLYSNSENSLNWIFQNLGDTNLAQNINLFKDKIKFRKLLTKIYPDFFFKEVGIQELDELDVSQIKTPFIIKPAVGFLSIGVYPVYNKNDWSLVLSSLKSDMLKYKGLFPSEVMDSSKFIIEELIKGEEFAVDAYFDNNGEPVILNIFNHPFVSENDVSDRVYLTSKNILKKYVNKFENLLNNVGNLLDLKNFPMHIELRVKDENISVIEINPMRFAGWCAADLAYYAYGINVYEYYLNQQKPDWDKIIAQSDDSIFYITFAELPQTINKHDIKDIDYEGFLKNIKSPVEIRKINYKEYPLFAIVIAKTNGYQEIQNILTIDLKKYITF